MRARAPRNRVVQLSKICSFGRRSVMLRALWIWQRWIAAAEPKVRRIAFDNAFAPSTMNSLAPSGRAARDQVVQQGLNRCGVLGCPFHQRQRMLVAFTVDPDRGDQHEIVAEMQPVDLDHQKVERGQIGSHEVGQPRRRQRHKPSRGADFEIPSGRCRYITLGQPDSAAEPARRYIDRSGKLRVVGRLLMHAAFLFRRKPRRSSCHHDAERSIAHRRV